MEVLSVTGEQILLLKLNERMFKNGEISEDEKQKIDQAIRAGKYL